MKMPIPQEDTEILQAIEKCQGVVPGSHRACVEGCTCPSVAGGVIDLQDDCPFHGRPLKEKSRREARGAGRK